MAVRLYLRLIGQNGLIESYRVIGQKIKVENKDFLKDIEDKIETLKKEKEKIEKEQKKTNEKYNFYNKTIQKISKNTNTKLKTEKDKSISQ